MAQRSNDGRDSEADLSGDCRSGSMGGRRAPSTGAPPQWSSERYGRCGANVMATAQPCARAQAARLASTIEGEVIPRLMLALKNAADTRVIGLPSFVPTREHVVELALLSYGPVEAESLRYVERLEARGMSLETIYLELLAPAARHLNHLWVEDICDFSDVTVGLGRLHRIVRKMSPSFRMGASDLRGCTSQWSGERKRAVLAPVAGEQHSFGCVMIEDFFVRAGWEVSGWPQSSEKDLVDTMRSDYYDLVGFSVSCEHHLEMLQQQIKAIRRASRNQSLIIMVGGRVFNADPKLVQAVGADMTGTDGRDAVTAADAAMTRLMDSL